VDLLFARLPGLWLKQINEFHRPAHGLGTIWPLSIQPPAGLKTRHTSLAETPGQ
jgi:hypothetical protein